MALTACTGTVGFQPGTTWQFVQSVPTNVITSAAGGAAGVAQVACLYRRTLRITWTCCGVTTYTIGQRYQLRSAGPTSTSLILHLSIPLPGGVAQAFGASIATAYWFVDPAAADALCTGGGAVISTKDIYDTVFADCSAGSSYIKYPWGAKQNILPGGALGPITMAILDVVKVLHQLLVTGERIFISNNPVIQVVPDEGKIIHLIKQHMMKLILGNNPFSFLFTFDTNC